MPARDLDPANPKDAFLLRLRKLWVDNGQPSPRKIASLVKHRGLVGGSRSAVQETLDGAQLPSWKTVNAMVLAISHGREKPEDYLADWEAARLSEMATDDEGEGGDEHAPAYPGAAAVEESNEAPRMRLFRVTVAASAVVGGVVGFLLAYFIPGPTATRQGPTTPRAAIVEVLNKLAVGPSDFVEDPKPAYLSTERVAYCADKGCSIQPYRFSSGVLLIATCLRQGSEIVNYNRESTTSQTNPNRFSSTLWYWVVLPDGQAGYISEVWLGPSSRGGLGLPMCPDD